METMESIEGFKKDLEELDRVIPQIKRANILRVLEDTKQLLITSLKSAEVKLEKDRKEHEKSERQRLEKESIQREVSEKNSKKEEIQPIAQPISVSTIFETEIKYVTITKYSFEDKDAFAKVYFLDFPQLKLHDQSKIKVEFSPFSITVYIHDWNGKNYKYYNCNLYRNLLPDDCYFKSTANGLVLFLKKESTSYWEALEKKAPLIDEAKLEPEIRDNPAANLMEMMKEAYRTGDKDVKEMVLDSMKRASMGKGLSFGNFNKVKGMQDVADFKWKENNN